MSGSILASYPLMLVYDVSDENGFVSGANSGLTGLTSGAVASVSNVISHDLVRNSGDVIYLENISPVTRSPSTGETFTIVIKY